MQSPSPSKDEISMHHLHMDSFKSSSLSPRNLSPISGLDSSPHSVSSPRGPASSQQLAKQLSTRLYSEQLLRYQSESIINSQKDNLSELKELTRNEVKKLQVLLEKSHEREIALLEDRERYKARLISIWLERRDWKIMCRWFSAWKEHIHNKRQHVLQEKMSQFKAFWIWRGLSASEKTVNLKHLQAVEDYVNLTSQERLLRWAFQAWKNSIRESSISKFQFISTLDSQMQTNIPRLNLSSSRLNQRDDGMHGADEVQTISVELLDEEYDRRLNYSNGSPIHSSLPDLDVPRQNLSARGIMKAKQDSLSNRLSKPKRKSERFHSIEMKWNAEELRHTSQTSTPRGSTPLSSRSSSRKKRRSSSSKRVRLPTSSMRQSSNYSPLSSPRIEAQHDLSTPKSARSNRSNRSSFHMEGTSPSRTPRLTEEDKRRIREILESEMKRK